MPYTFQGSLDHHTIYPQSLKATQPWIILEPMDPYLDNPASSLGKGLVNKVRTREWH